MEGASAEDYEDSSISSRDGEPRPPLESPLMSDPSRQVAAIGTNVKEDHSTLLPLETGRSYPENSADPADRAWKSLHEELTRMKSPRQAATDTVWRGILRLASQAASARRLCQTLFFFISRARDICDRINYLISEVDDTKIPEDMRWSAFDTYNELLVELEGHVDDICHLPSDAFAQLEQSSIVSWFTSRRLLTNALQSLLKLTIPEDLNKDGMYNMGLLSVTRHDGRSWLDALRRHRLAQSRSDNSYLESACQKVALLEDTFAQSMNDDDLTECMIGWESILYLLFSAQLERNAASFISEWTVELLGVLNKAIDSLDTVKPQDLVALTEVILHRIAYSLAQATGPEQFTSTTIWSVPQHSLEGREPSKPTSSAQLSESEEIKRTKTSESSLDVQKVHGLQNRQGMGDTVTAREAQQAENCSNEGEVADSDEEKPELEIEQRPRNPWLPSNDGSGLFETFPLTRQKTPTTVYQSSPSQLQSTAIRPDVSNNTVLSWTSNDPLRSQLFSQFGTLYRFDTGNINGKTITNLFRAVNQGREDRIAKLEWGVEGSLGRATIGRNIVSMLDLVRPDGAPFTRVFTGPNGYQYRWRPDPYSSEYMLEDFNGNLIASYRPISPAKKCNIGEVHGEICFIVDSGKGTVPMMDMICLTAMLNRILNAQGM